MNRPGPGDIRRIHLIFKTHLDVGFTDFAATVIKNYFTSYIPQAIDLARDLREKQCADRFIWTTGSWLIYEYLEQAGPSDRRKMEEAIFRGDITWHALPFTTHSECMDASLFKFGLSLSQQLDLRFGKKTIAAKMTDVPGHTRGIISPLAEAGVEFLHIGVNGASTPPEVPPVFTWKEQGGANILVMYHKGSYGDLMVIPGCPEAIAFAHTGDNLGPQSVEDLRQTYHRLRSQFPDCEILASTMDAFAKELLKIKGSLPIITNEIGDTWIHGIGTDPKKIAQFRELLRLRRDLLTKELPEETLAGFSRKLLMIPEHTWGLDVKTHLNDWKHYSASEFKAVREQENFRKIEQSWQEQRVYIYEAVDALPGELKGEAQVRLKSLEPSLPDRELYNPITDLTRPFSLGKFKVVVDIQSGWLSRLELDGIPFADEKHPLGKFWYETFSAVDYQRFYRQYNVNKRETWFWAIPDFTKPGIEKTAKEHLWFYPHLIWAGEKKDPKNDSVLLQLEMPVESWQQYGAPKVVWVKIQANWKTPDLYIHLQWFEKPACRLPEALWFSFFPQLTSAGDWTLDKLGQWINPHDVIRGGNRHLHAVGDGGVSYNNNNKNMMRIHSLDAALIAPGKPSLLDFQNRPPNLKKGIHFNLYNNLWGTNFPMWYEDNASFRFHLNVKAIK